ncbi:MAG: diaminopimelate epimerase [Christensenellaceae bacterium]|jgi:diaminopimelate epimerase|nr:diaminopimelate epimerase [Christensenellaceae bacterium]
MKFVKMNGTGNDFILIYNDEWLSMNCSRVAKILCDRHYAIGADGLVVIGKSKIANFSMQIYNSDGSRAAMCGNAIRCVAKYLYEKAYINCDNFSIQTESGIKHLELSITEGVVQSIKVDMGIPQLVTTASNCRHQTTITTKVGMFIATLVDIGNLHAVVVLDEHPDDAHGIAKAIAESNQFTDGINVELVRIVDDTHISALVWERGAGCTLSCGTGAVAVAFVSLLQTLCKSDVYVSMPGGDLKINFENQHAFLEGPAEENFHGELGYNLYSKL